MIAGSGGGGYAACPNGLLWTWGVGAGALAGGPDRDSLVPVRLTGLPRVARVAASPTASRVRADDRRRAPRRASS